MQSTLQPALFLDRDGVINVNHGYVYKAEQVEFIDGIFALIKRFVAAGFQPVIVTNQSGIARGYYDEQAFAQVSEYFQMHFSQHDLPTIPVYHCPFHPDFSTPEQCRTRKPEPGMLLDAAAELALDLSASVMIGDKFSDVVAASRAQVGRAVLLSTDKSQIEALENASWPASHQTQVEVLSVLDDIRVPKTGSCA